MLLSDKYAFEFWLMLDIKRSETSNWPQIYTCRFGDGSIF